MASSKGIIDERRTTMRRKGMEGKKKSKSTTEKAATATVKKKTETIPSIEFTLHAPNAKEVFVAGDFNDWNSTQYPMRKFKDGIWKKSMKLKPGRFEYKFVVDGDWWTDPQNPERQATPFGAENSIVTVS